MDVRHRKVWLELKLPNQTQTQIIEAESIVSGLQQISRLMHEAPNRYGDGHIKFSFTSIKDSNDLATRYPGYDFSNMTQATSDEEDAWASNPINPDSPLFDPILREYKLCASSVYRASKTPEELKTYRTHTESNYRNTPHWNGSHYW